MPCLVLQVMLGFLLTAFCVFSFHASTHMRGAVLNAVPMVWLHLLLAASARFAGFGLHADLAVQAIVWTCIAAGVGALIARRGRLLRNRAGYEASLKAA